MYNNDLNVDLVYDNVYTKLVSISLFVHKILKKLISYVNQGPLLCCKGPRTVSYSICPNFDSLWLAKCITDNYGFVFK